MSPLAISLPALIGPDFASRWVFVVLGFVLSAWGFRAAYAYVRADDAGVVVVNPIRTRRFSWNEISGFTLG